MIQLSKHQKNTIAKTEGRVSFVLILVFGDILVLLYRLMTHGEKSILTVVLLLWYLSGHALGVKSMPGALSLAVGAQTDATDLVIEGSINADDFKYLEKSMKNLRSLDLSNVQIEEGRVPEGVFAGSSLECLSLPSGCRVECMAFSGSKLRSVDIVGGCVLDDGAFSACKHLTSIKIGGPAFIGNNVFIDDDCLTCVEGSENITVIGNRAFDGCSSLAEFTFSPSLRSLGHRAFAGTALNEANLASCTELDSVGAWAFANCSNMQSAILPAKHGKGVFFGCPALQSVVFNGTDISDFALTHATSMEKIMLPAALEYIGASAMEGMTALKEIDGRNLSVVPALGSDVWARTQQQNVLLKVMPELADAFEAAPQWCEFNIAGVSSIDIIEAVNNGVKAAFIGERLVAESTAGPISCISVFDIAGRMRMHAVVASVEKADVDASALAAAAYIVEITLADGSRHTAKLIK